MNQIDHHCFVKHYKYKDKIEQDAFMRTYVIHGDIRSYNQPEKKRQRKLLPQNMRKQVKEQVKQQVKDIEEWSSESQQQEVETVIEEKQVKSVKKEKIIQYEIQQSPITSAEPQNNKNIKKKKYKKVEEPQEQYQKQKFKGKNRTEKRREKKQHAKKKIYNEYTNLNEIESSRKKNQKKYYKGRVQFGEGTKQRARIVSEQLEGHFMIEGIHRNRALHDDKVYFSIMHEDKKHEKLYCKVDYIFPSKRQIVGKLEYYQSKDLYVLNPINLRISSFNVQKETVKKQYRECFNTHYFIGEFLEWDICQDYPKCEIKEVFGKFGDIDIETGSLLKIHNIEDKEYEQEEVKLCLKKFLDLIDETTGEYMIPKEEIAKRQDLRAHNIFTIDPYNAKDFDDALSVQRSANDCHRVGIHIADPSFFVEEGSFIDQQAKKRTTSVYLVHRVIPMLPRILCENLCSLNPGYDRLTITIWVTLDKQGNIIQKPKLSRSVIHSKARFTYEQAQLIIEGRITNQDQIEKGFGCINKDNFDNTAKDVMILYKVSQLLRTIRINRGSLFFQIPKKAFKLGQNSYPIQYSIYERKQAHFLVQELMILANEQVGTIIVEEIKQNALLRRHKYPGIKKIQRFEQFMKKINMPFKITSQSRVQDQINKILMKKQLKQSIRDIVKYQMISLLQAADYFIVNKSQPASWIHYALNSPVYTHFTSPIRRYPDIIVHRMLCSIINKKKIDRETNQLIERCNQKKLQSKRISNGCEKIFMCLYLRKNVVFSRGIISEVEDWGIKVCMPKLDFKGILRFKEISKLNILSFEEDASERKILRLEYKGQIVTKFILKQYQQIELKLSCKEGFPLDYKLTIVMPNPKNPAQHLLIQ